MVGERPLESNDFRASNIGLVVSDPRDEDALEDDSELFSSVLAQRQDIEIVLRAAPSEAEEVTGSVDIVWGPAGQGIFEYCLIILSSPVNWLDCLISGPVPK